MGWYVSVNRRIAKAGLADIDALVYRTTVTRETAEIYVKAILGPTFPLRFRRGMSYAGRGGRYITLSLDLIESGRMPLGTVLHECAHAKQYMNNPRECRKHGEAFTTSYRKILISVTT